MQAQSTHAHGERIYVSVDPSEKASFRALGGRYGHGMAPFHDLASNAKFVTCAVHEMDADPAEHDCCLYHDRDYTLFYTPEQARNLKALDKALYWKAWYWSNARVCDDLDSEADIRQHLAGVHAQSPFARFSLDVPTYLSLRQQAYAVAASFVYENPNPQSSNSKNARNDIKHRVCA
jgi:hypothetical protein